MSPGGPAGTVETLLTPGWCRSEAPFRIALDIGAENKPRVDEAASDDADRTARVWRGRVEARRNGGSTEGDPNSGPFGPPFRRPQAHTVYKDGARSHSADVNNAR